MEKALEIQPHPFTGILVLLWCCIFFYSLVGWGMLVAALARLEKPGSGLAAALGIALQCLLGGVLNLAHLINTPLLLVTLLIGLVAAAREHRVYQTPLLRALQLWQNRGQRDRLIFLGVFLLLFLRLISFVRVTAYNPWDDYQVYLLFPIKMLQLHHLPADPFSQRRVISSVGFCYYLQDLFLTLAPLKNMSLVDGGLGTLLLVTASAGISRALALSRRQTICFLALAAVVKQIYFNLSFAWLPCGLFLAMVLIAFRKDLREHRPRLQAFCLGGLAGAATGLKNNYIVFAVVFIFLLYLVFALVPRAGSTPSRLFGRLLTMAESLALSAAGLLLVLGLWMIDLHHYAGTFFFPILGHGYEYTAYHLLPDRISHTPATVLKSIAYGVPVLLIAIGEALWARWNRFTSLTVLVTIAAALSTMITALATGNDSVRRYCYPQIMVALLLLFPLVCNEVNSGRRVRGAFYAKLTAISVVLAGSLIGFGKEHFAFDERRGFVHHHLQDFVAGLRNRELNSSDELAEYRALQASLPPHSTVIETVSYPYLLDNRNQTYFETSLPAMASPPPAPGWPIHSNGEELARWLQTHGVQYLMYSYRDHAFQFDEYMPKLILDTNWPLILRSTWTANLKAHAQYLELAHTRHHVFDDGKIFILDLNRRESVPFVVPTP